LLKAIYLAKITLVLRFYEFEREKRFPAPNRYVPRPLTTENERNFRIMQHRVHVRKTSFASVTKRLAIASLLFLTALSIPGFAQGVSLESVPFFSISQNSPNITVPVFQAGTLFLAEIQKPVGGSTTSTETSRHTIATNVYRLADVNHLTGTYLFQTDGGGDREGPANITTWLGEPNKQPVRLYTGAGYVKLSPGGSYVAATDANGVLHVIDRYGDERLVLGKANNAIFSPDGTKIAYFKTIPYVVGDSGGIEVADLASGKTVATYHPDGAAYIPLAFEENGKVLYFATPKKAAGVNDNSDENRVDVYALSLEQKSESRLITMGAKKLPYMDYGRIEYLIESHLLVLLAENTAWTVNTQSGEIQVSPNVSDLIRVDSNNALLAHQSDKSASNRGWNVVAAH
jgi:hypothetical protein